MPNRYRKFVVSCVTATCEIERSLADSIDELGTAVGGKMTWIRDSEIQREKCVLRQFVCTDKSGEIAIAIRMPHDPDETIDLTASVNLLRLFAIWNWKHDHDLLKRFSRAIDARGAIWLYLDELKVD